MKFNPSISKTFKDTFAGVEVREKSYVLTGSEVSDEVQFGNKLRAELNFVTARDAKGILKFVTDGVLGLSAKGNNLIAQL